ncbi:unnamed protein product, partial [Meganyctiphanes norvegica]
MSENNEIKQKHMFTPLASGCGSPYFEVQDKLIQICDHQASQAKAQEICREGNGDLISLEKISLFDKLLERPEMKRDSIFWVNAHYQDSSSSYVWTSGAELIHGWLPAKPSSNRYHCVLLAHQSNDSVGMTDGDCKLNKKFICAKEDDGDTKQPSGGCGSPFIKLEGLLVQICNKRGTWTEARAMCKEVGADLISLTRTQLVKELVVMSDLANYSWWVGGHYEQSSSSYVWLSGEEIGRGWMPVKPSSDKYQCVALGLSGKGIGGLNDLDCKKWTKFICMKDKVSIKNTTK